MKWFTFSLFAIFMFVISSCNHRQSAYKSYEDYPAYVGDDLGVTVADGKTRFVLWTPTAEAVQIRIYDNGENGDYGQQVETPGCFTFQQRDKTDMKYQCVDNNRD